MKSRSLRSLFTIVVLSIGLQAYAHSVHAKDGMYKVTVTNITRGISITPLMVTTHKRGVQLFDPGKPASRELAMLAEGGDFGPLSAALFAQGVAYDTATNGALLPPGQSVSVMVKMRDDFDYVSVAAMLLPTNDGFISVNGVRGPESKDTVEIFSPAYDAGSEPNDELCINIPGPTCGGEGFNEGDGEGFVHIHAGIHGTGNLNPAEYDWRNPVARIQIERVK